MPGIKGRARPSAAALVFIITLAGCQGQGTTPQQAAQQRKPPRASLVLRVQAAPDLNPNGRGEATPVDVRVYQLDDRVAFTEVSFEELWTSAERLGTSALGEPKVFTFEPQPADAPPQAHELKLDPKAQFLGIMALYAAERKEGLEERKLCVAIDEAAMKVVLLSGHSVRLVDPTQ
ncbi:MAG: type VI secretion system lipoprotein TssJ [Planctomycetes bacterium]|nr:type VI secretion system lipoprotein TssJ [Planctomycetota bacterium]